MNVKEIYPIQKCINGHNVRDLSDVELLSIAIGAGCKGESVYSLASRIYYDLSGLRGIYSAGVHKLSQIRGIGETKSIRILSALEMGRRIVSREISSFEVNNPEKVWRCVLSDITGIGHEIFIVIVLNSKNRVLRKSIVSSGTVSETLVHPREVFRMAITENGSSIIICHNHPSGNTEPSQNDINITDRLLEASRIIGIELLDHLIVTEKGFYSLREGGYFG
ncbi:MAG: DNA repair protein RadC [Spirochaetes bacterium]|jgi:DNA repair protein RadC|nr:DNA repair protein RadC [Spirochaetota bacterium]